MCRSKSRGGRRCTGGKCAESRRARQRAYQARKRAAAKSFTTALREAQELAPVTVTAGGGVLDGLKPAFIPITHLEPYESGGMGISNGKAVVPILMYKTMNAMIDDGRFDILDKPLTAYDRAAIAAMSAEEVGEKLSALRDHLGAEMIVSEADKTGDPELAERTARYIGDVASAWIDGQIAEQLDYADRYAHTFGLDMAALAEQAEDVEKAMHDASDNESRVAAYRRRAELSQEKSALGNGFKAFAKSVGDARAEALSELLAQTVGAEDGFPVAKITGQKKMLTESLKRTSAYYPDSWKEATKGLSPLTVKYSEARAHYCANEPVRGKPYVPYIDKDVDYAVFAEPTPVEITSARTRQKVTVLASGDADNPEHMAQYEALKAKLEAADKAWLAEQNLKYLPDRKKCPPVWEIYENSAGRLAIRETLRGSMRTLGYEATVKTSKAADTLTHEMAHRMEHGNPHLRAVCEEFIRRRTTDENGIQERPIRYYSDREPVFADKLIHAYTGKMYSKLHTEVLSTGMEMLFHGEFGAGLGYGMASSKYEREDPDSPGRMPADKEHLDLVMGLLLSAKKKGS